MRRYTKKKRYFQKKDDYYAYRNTIEDSISNQIENDSVDMEIEYNSMENISPHHYSHELYSSQSSHTSLVGIMKLKKGKNMYVSYPSKEFQGKAGSRR